MIDLIIVLIIGASIGVGYKKGLIKTIYELGTSVLALGISFVIYPILTTLLKLTPIYISLIEWNKEKISSFEIVSGLQGQAEMIRSTTSHLPSFITEALVKNNNKEVYALLGVNEVVEYIATYIANICITALAIVITFIIVKIILIILGGFLDFVTRLPVIHTANQLGGIIIGGVKGLLFVYLGLLVVPFLNTISNFSGLIQQVQNSLLGSYLYQNNILLILLSDFIL
jgi:uncharacterized membrane protein required for colicin V production